MVVSTKVVTPQQERHPLDKIVNIIGSPGRTVKRIVLQSFVLMGQQCLIQGVIRTNVLQTRVFTALLVPQQDPLRWLLCAGIVNCNFV